jgi:hypothetical protein
MSLDEHPPKRVDQGKYVERPDAIREKGVAPVKCLDFIFPEIGRVHLDRHSVSREFLNKFDYIAKRVGLS